ncbi:MAG: 50S ribosomal protein L17 [Phycisphaerales bacterium]|nr:50S ribosomal protein L17 [Phycisphaerales bacterium]
MRHRVAHRKFNRTKEHRSALRRNMVQNLVEHGSIRTTLPKAKDLRPFVEKMITLAKRAHAAGKKQNAPASLRARRQLHKHLSDRSIVPEAHRSDYANMSDAHRLATLQSASGRRYRTGEPKGRLAFTGESVLHRLIEVIAPKFADRPGGYTRVIKLADRRVGDHSPLAILQLVGDETGPGSLAKPKRSARKRRTDARYAAAVKVVKGAAKA